MVCVTDFHAGNGGYSVMPSAEYDGYPATIIHEFACLVSLRTVGVERPTASDVPI
jgi:hypothetical protein